MTGGILKAAAGLALASALLIPGRAALGQAEPLALDDCNVLALELAGTVPISAPFETGIEWFRDGDLGIKGRQCRVSIEGPARRDKGAKASPGMEDMVHGVTAGLGKHGYATNKMVDRYTRKGKTYRAFAMRKDRITCWTNIEVASPPAPAGGATSGAHAPAPQAAPVWTLTVDCFKG